MKPDLMTSSQGQGQRKWDKMVEVNGAYKQGSHEAICLKSLCVQRQSFRHAKWIAIYPYKIWVGSYQ